MQKTTWLGTTLLLLALAGCSGEKSGTKLARGYLATDACAQHVTAGDCSAGCRWVDVGASNGCGTGGKLCASPLEGSAGTGACVADDRCLSLGKDACAGDATCAWSTAKTLCPIGATCDDGGYCHSRDAGGTDCGCVSPLSSSADGTVVGVECDCSGGGSGGGTTGSGGGCACACAACPPGEVCPPCDCQCSDGGSTCTAGTTCACACPACPPGETCAPCDCSCADGGGTVIAGGTGSGGSATSPSSGTGSSCTCPACPADTACAPCECGAPPSGCDVPATPTNPPTGVCPALGCDPACPKGTTTDANGCPTCTCA